MGVYQKAIVTDKGNALLAKAVAGVCHMQFTKIALGSDKLTGDLASKVSIGSIKQSSQIATAVIQNDTTVSLEAPFENKELKEGYYIRNIGLYAMDPDEGEILYSISVADESKATANWMPAYSGVYVHTLLIELVTSVTHASEVEVMVDPSLYVTVNQFNNKITEINTKIDDLMYEPIKILSATNSASIVEKGSTITEVSVTWSTNKDPVSQKVNGNPVDPTLRSYTITGLYYTRDVQISVWAKDERDATDKLTTSITFVNGLYWGVVEDGTDINSSVIQGLNKILKGSKECSFTIDTPASMRVVFALPASLGTPTFMSGGLVADMYKDKSFEFENARGYRETYDVWISQELVNNANGVIPMEVH